MIRPPLECPPGIEQRFQAAKIGSGGASFKATQAIGVGCPRRSGAHLVNQLGGLRQRAVRLLHSAHLAHAGCRLHAHTAVEGKIGQHIKQPQPVAITA